MLGPSPRRPPDGGSRHEPGRHTADNSTGDCAAQPTAPADRRKPGFDQMDIDQRIESAAKGGKERKVGHFEHRETTSATARTP